MSGIVIKGFSGMRPVLDAKLINPNEAQFAKNTRLTSGVIESYKSSVPLTAVRSTGDINSLFRARRLTDESQNWFEFAGDVDAIRSPVYQDDYNRTYWTGEEFPKYAPEIVGFAAGTGPFPRSFYQLGVPAPVAENQRPSVAGTAVVEADMQNREYLMTYANAAVTIESGPTDVFATKVLTAPFDSGHYIIESVTIESSTTALVLFTTVVDMDDTFQAKLFGFTNSAWNSVFDITALVNERTIRITTPASMPTTGGTEQYGKRRTKAAVTFSSFPNSGYDDARIEKMVLYRNVSGTYKKIATLPISTTDYIDSLVDADCASLPSMPTSLQYRPATPIMAPTASVPYTDTSIADNPTLALTQRIYATSFVSESGAESNLSPDSGLINVIDGMTKVTITSALIPPANAEKKRIYRQNVTVTDTGYLTIDQANYKLVIECPASQDTFTDVLPDSGMTGRAAPSILNGIEPPSYPPASQGALAPIIIAETRVYVYTHVTEYGEEGPPSLPSFSASIDPTEPVVISNLAVAPTGAYNITKKYLYRTNGGDTTTNYQFVAEIPIATTSYEDRLKGAELGEVIPSIDWQPPPADMKGLRMMANGIATGYSGKDVLFSPAFMPHAYPTTYRMTLEDTIVGIGVFGQSVVAMTNTFPYVINGIDPQSMTMTKTSVQQACVSKRSIVETGDGVIYASPDGLMVFNASGFKLATEKLLTPQQWLAYNPTSMHSYIYENRLHVFYTLADEVTKGLLIFDFSGESAAFITSDAYTTAASYVPELDSMLVVDGSNLSKLDKGDPLTYVWRSKMFEFPNPTNYAFGQVIAKSYGSGVTFKIYADGVLRHTQTVTSENAFRLPGGFKARNWYIEVSGNTVIQTIVVVKTAAELRQV